MTTPALSILIPSIPSRLTRFSIPLFEKLQAQAAGHPAEILMLTDNKARSVGHKRNALLAAARGAYVAFCDDDDEVADDYIAALGEATQLDVDVITFQQRVIVNGAEGIVHFGLRNPDEPFKPGAITLRRPWHPCAWRRSLVRDCIFTDKMFGEDADWVAQAAPLGETEHHIPRILQTYRYSSTISEAPAS